MSHIRILVVDDHPDVRTLVTAILASIGYQADTASDGLDATRKLTGSPYDLVITDLKMPAMDGLALLKYITGRFPHTDVMMITGHATIENAVEAIKLGAYDYLTKPLNADELQIRIRNWSQTRALRRETERLGAIVSLTKLSHTLTGNLDLGSLSRQIVALVEDTFQSQYSSLMLVEPKNWDKGGAPQVVAFSSTDGIARPQWATEEVMGFVVRERKPWTGSFDGLDSDTAGSGVCVPLCHRDEVIGLLNTARSPGRAPYSREDVQLLGVFGAQIAIALENARAYRELKELNLGTITALVTAVEARDPYTGGHSERVARYAVATATAIGLSHTETEDLHVAGLLHDIGKIGISDLILNKQGSLTSDEYEAVKQHPRIGGRFLRGHDIIESLPAPHEHRAQP